MREVLPLLVALGIEARNSGNGKGGSQITLEKTPTAGPPDGGSKTASATTDATTEDLAEESALESGGSRGRNYGHSSPSMSQTGEENGKNELQNGAVGRECPTDATSATSATPTPAEASEPPSIAGLLAKPPDWLRQQADKHLEKPSDRTLNPLCVAVAAHLYSDAGRWQEVKPAVERWLEGGQP